MNSEYEKQLELEIDRALKGLPELEAPRGLMPRVMAAIERRAALPWYRQPWQEWPLALQTVSMLILLGSFGGLCVASWQLTRAAGFTLAMQEVGQLFSGIAVIWNILTVLVGAVVLVLKHLGTPVLAGCLVAVGLGYAICVGLGTLCVRLAFARK